MASILAADALITAEEYRKFTGDTDQKERDDTTLETHINAASSFISDYCDRTFIADGANHTEIFDGNGQLSTYAYETPIVSITSLSKWDGTAYTVTTGTYVYDAITGRMRFTSGHHFDEGADNWQLIYKYGVTRDNVPQHLKFACAQLVYRNLKKMRDDKEGMNSEAFDANTTSYNLSSLPADLRMILDGFRRAHLA